MKNNFELKSYLYNQCTDFVENRWITIKNTVNDIQESLNAETKNTSGDKHETGRAMLQIDLEKAGNQLLEIQKLKDILKRIDITKILETVGLGSIVCTTKSNYFIAVSAGVMSVEAQTFYAIAADTPIGQLLISKRTGEEIIFRDETIKIEAIF